MRFANVLAFISARLDVPSPVIRANWYGATPTGAELSTLVNEADIFNYLIDLSNRKMYITIYLPITILKEYSIFADYTQYVQKRPLMYAAINEGSYEAIFAGSIWTNNRISIWNSSIRSPPPANRMFTPKSFTLFLLAKIFESKGKISAEDIRKTINTVLTAKGEPVMPNLEPTITEGVRLGTDSSISRFEPIPKKVLFGAVPVTFDSGIQSRVPDKARPVKYVGTYNNMGYIPNKTLPAVSLSDNQITRKIKQQSGMSNPSIAVVTQTSSKIAKVAKSRPISRENVRSTSRIG
jgi:hypothetical protein